MHEESDAPGLFRTVDRSIASGCGGDTPERRPKIASKHEETDPPASFRIVDRRFIVGLGEDSPVETSANEKRLPGYVEELRLRLKEVESLLRQTTRLLDEARSQRRASLMNELKGKLDLDKRLFVDELGIVVHNIDSMLESVRSKGRRKSLEEDLREMRNRCASKLQLLGAIEEGKGSARSSYARRANSTKAESEGFKQVQACRHVLSILRVTTRTKILPHHLNMLEELATCLDRLQNKALKGDGDLCASYTLQCLKSEDGEAVSVGKRSQANCHCTRNDRMCLITSLYMVLNEALDDVRRDNCITRHLDLVKMLASRIQETDTN